VRWPPSRGRTSSPTARLEGSASPLLTIAGLPAYVEERGGGPALLYLHGAAEWIGYAEPLTGLLARDFRVIEAERRGHGRTPDVPGPITYDAMTGDTIALLDHLDLGPVPLVGYSDGGIVALLVAIARPDLVSFLVAIGPNARVDGLTGETLAWLAEVTPDTWPAENREAYERLSPDGPGHWPAVCEKIRLMLLREPDIPTGELARITAPTLLIGGDRDAIRLEHFLELHRSIAGSELCILPGAPHELPVAEPQLVADLIKRFGRRFATA
jgi:pimeloyl-ACP methyl ester carboxylesterase